MSGLRIFGAPRRYVQGPGALAVLAELVGELGERPVVVGDHDVLQRLGDELRGALAPRWRDVALLGFDGLVTAPLLDDLAVRAGDADVVIGAGGGRSLDAGRGVARRLVARLVTVPTIASSDSSTSRAIPIHHHDSDEIGIERLTWNPDAVVADTSVIAAAPTRFLRWGIGDALTTSYELAASHDSGATNGHGGLVTVAAVALAEACRDTVRLHGVAAVAAVEQGIVTPELEDIVEAALLLSGLGMENGGLSIAHSIGVALPLLADGAHGEQVAYGLLVQLALEGGGERLDDVAGFLAQIGLPTSLHALGAGDVEPVTLAERALSAPWVASHPSRPDQVALTMAIEETERRAASLAR